MQIIDMNSWNRREIFTHFSALSNPFYTFSFTVDVTGLYDYKRAHGISFYYSLCWLCAKAMNSVENFRYAIRGGQVVLLEKRIPSFTDVRPGSDLFYCVTPPDSDSLDAYCISAKEYSAAQKVFLDMSVESDELIFISCVPGLRLLTATNARDLKDPSAADSNIPSLCWGKYVDTNGRKELNMSLEVNHRFVDGLHIQRFAGELERRIAALRP